MNEDLARVVAAASIGLTVFGVGVAVLFSRRESRVRLPMDVAVVWLTLGALAGAALVTGVHTDPLLAGGAGLLGFILGGAQGSQLRVRRDGDRLFARRGAIALAAWGAGLIVVQSASLASREGVVEIGQAVAYFGVGGAFGLIVGRESAIRRLAPAGAAVVAIAVVVVTPSFEQAAAQETETVEVIAITNSQAILQAFGAADASLAVLGNGTESEVVIRFPSAGGAATGSGDAIIEDFKLGVLIHAIELIAEGIGETVGGAITGGGSDSGVSDRPVRPELANCTSIFGAGLVLEGTYDPASGTLTGPATATFYFDDATNCPADTPTGEFNTASGSWTATYRDGSFNGEVRFETGEAEAMIFPLTGKAPEPEPEPTEEPAAVASPEGAADPGEEPGDDEEPVTQVIAPPVSVDDIKPDEAAAAGIIGAGAAGLVGLISAASAAASAPANTGEPGRREEDGEPGDEVGDISEFDRKPVVPAAIGEGDVEIAARNIAKLADKGGYDDILAAIQSRMKNGELDPQTLETLRRILKERMDIDAALASSDLMNRSDLQAFADGYRSDLAKLADLLMPGSGIVIRDPYLAARIIAGMATLGKSEAIFIPIDILTAITAQANTPGQDLTNAGAAAEIAKVVAWEGGKEIAAEVLMGGAGKLVGVGFDAARGGAKGVDLSGLGKGLPANQLDEAAGAAARGGPPSAALDPSGKIPQAEIDAMRPREMPNSPISRETPVTAGGPPAPETPRADVPATPRGDTVFDPDYRPGTPSVVPKVDDTFLREAPNGTKLGPDQLAATGYTPGQIEDMQRIARENDVLIGTRATNPASAHHIQNGSAVPKPLDVKQKTTNAIDLQIGGRPENEGLVSVFKPTEPRPQDFRNPGEYKQAMERWATRADEYNDLVKKLPELEKKGITWDRETGLLRNADGKPFAGDIDGVYVKDAQTGQFLGPGNPTYDRVMQQMAESRVQGQHGFETGSVVDISNAKGPNATAGAMKLHDQLSSAHEQGKEILIEVGVDGTVQKGPRPWGMHDVLNPTQSPLQRGIPMALPE